jgi:hypothetical protein
VRDDSYYQPSRLNEDVADHGVPGRTQARPHCTAGLVAGLGRNRLRQGAVWRQTNRAGRRRSPYGMRTVRWRAKPRRVGLVATNVGVAAVVSIRSEDAEWWSRSSGNPEGVQVSADAKMATSSLKPADLRAPSGNPRRVTRSAKGRGGIGRRPAVPGGSARRRGRRSSRISPRGARSRLA